MIYKVKSKDNDFTKSEIDCLIVEIDNIIYEEKIVEIEFINSLLEHLDKNERQEVKRAIDSKPYIKKVEGTYHYVEKEEYDNIDEGEIYQSLTKPHFVNSEKDYVQVGQKVFQCQYVAKVPEMPQMNWLALLTGERSNMDFAVHIAPTSKHQQQFLIDDELKRIDIAIKLKNPDDPSIRDLEDEKERLLEKKRALNRDTFYFDASIYLMTKGDTIDEVNEMTEDIKTNLQGDDIISEHAEYLQEPIFKSIIPSGINYLPELSITLPNNVVASSFLYSFNWMDVDIERNDKGVSILLGFNNNDLPIARCLWRSPKYIGAFIGDTGSGKSTAAKIFIDQENTYNHVNILVIDPAASTGTRPEYREMCKKKNGKLISISTRSKNIPPILALYPDDTFEKSFARVETQVNIYVGGDDPLTVPQKKRLKAALQETLKLAGIDKDKPQTWLKNQATLSLLYKVLKRRLSEAKRNGIQTAKETYDSLLVRLESSVGDGVDSYMDTRSSSLAVDNPFTVFEFNEVPPDKLQTMITTVLNYCKYRAFKNLDKTLIVLEEAHLWLKDPRLSAYIAELEVLLRKANAGLILIFQDLGQLEGCKEAYTLLNNMQFVYILGFDESVKKLTASKLGLNEIEQEIILNSDIGEGILKWGKTEHFHIYIKMNKETYDLVTTNPEEVKALLSAEKEREKVKQETLKLLNQDLGYAPESIGDGIKDLVRLIHERKMHEDMIDHYPKKYRHMILSQLGLLAKIRRRDIKPLTKKHYEEMEEPLRELKEEIAKQK